METNSVFDAAGALRPHPIGLSANHDGDFGGHRQERRPVVQASRFNGQIRGPHLRGGCVHMYG